MLVDEGFHVLAAAIAYTQVCLLNNLCSLLLCGNCLSISLKNSRAIFVLTFLLTGEGGLCQITLLCRL